MLTFQKSLISEIFWQNVTFSILVLLGAVSKRYFKIDKSSFDLIHLLGIMRKPLSEKWRGFYLEFKCNIKTHSHAIFSVLWMLKYSLVRQLASAILTSHLQIWAQSGVGGYQQFTFSCELGLSRRLLKAGISI